ncbi:TPA: hypothetical protein ACH3X1_000661 [Trebouxia sp. C0004]
MTSTSPGDNRSIGTEAAGLLLMCEQALLIQKNAGQGLVVVKGVNSWELFVVVLARGQQGTPHPVACLKRTNSGTFP